MSLSLNKQLHYVVWVITRIKRANRFDFRIWTRLICLSSIGFGDGVTFKYPLIIPIVFITMECKQNLFLDNQFTRFQNIIYIQCFLGGYFAINLIKLITKPEDILFCCEFSTFFNNYIRKFLTENFWFQIKAQDLDR